MTSRFLNNHKRELTMIKMWKAVGEMGLELGDKRNNSVLDMPHLICLLDMKR